MNVANQKLKQFLLALAISSIVTAGFMPDPARGQDVGVFLDGGQQVPPAATSAIGEATIYVSSDKAVNGEARTSGIHATAVHIHEGAPGVDGPIVISFVKIGEGTWRIDKHAILTDEQLENFKAGNLYIDVHSDAHPDGEIRGQIRP